jgi:hypothetical protein
LASCKASAALTISYTLLAGVRVVVYPSNQKEDGYYDENNNMIFINSASPNPRLILIHEIQHVIQSKEGFARGSNMAAAEYSLKRDKDKKLDAIRNNLLTEFLDTLEETGLVDKYRDLKKEYYFNDGERNFIFGNIAKDIVGAYYRRDIKSIEMSLNTLKTYISDGKLPAELKRYSDEISEGDKKKVKEIIENVEVTLPYLRMKAEAAKELTRSFAYERYKRTAGETEARNAEKRALMGKRERLEKMLADTEDVAREDQIILGKAARGLKKAISASEVKDGTELFKADEGLKEKFKKDVEEAIKNPDTNKTIDFGNIPPVLQAVFDKQRVKDKQLKTNQRAIRKGLGIQKNEKHNHNVPRDVMDRLPELVSDPVAIFKSLSDSTNPNGYVVVLNAMDNKNNPIVVAVSPSKNGGYSFIPTIYEKERFDKFVVKTAKEGGILYADKKRGSEIWGQLQSLPRHTQNLNKNIQTKEGVVNANEKKGNGIFLHVGKDENGGKKDLENELDKKNFAKPETAKTPGEALRTMARKFLKLRGEETSAKDVRKFVTIVKDFQNGEIENKENGEKAALFKEYVKDTKEALEKNNVETSKGFDEAAESLSDKTENTSELKFNADEKETIQKIIKGEKASLKAGTVKKIMRAFDGFFSGRDNGKAIAELIGTNGEGINALLQAAQETKGMSASIVREASRAPSVVSSMPLDRIS